MMSITQWDRIFIRHFEAHGPGLGKLQMVDLGGPPSADEARLVRHESQMIPVPDPCLLRDEKSAPILHRRRSTDLSQAILERGDEGGTCTAAIEPSGIGERAEV